MVLGEALELQWDFGEDRVQGLGCCCLAGNHEEDVHDDDDGDDNGDDDDDEDDDDDDIGHNGTGSGDINFISCILFHHNLLESEDINFIDCILCYCLQFQYMAAP